MHGNPGQHVRRATFLMHAPQPDPTVLAWNSASGLAVAPLLPALLVKVPIYLYLRYRVPEVLLVE